MGKPGNGRRIVCFPGFFLCVGSAFLRFASQLYRPAPNGHTLREIRKGVYVI